MVMYLKSISESRLVSMLICSQVLIDEFQRLDYLGKKTQCNDNAKKC